MAIYLDLTPTQRAELKTYISNPPDDIPLERLKVVLLSGDGMKPPEISRKIGLHAINVRKWIHRYQAQGVDGLYTGKSPGAPRKLTDQQRADIAKLYAVNPRTLGLNFARWSLKRMKKYLIDRGLVVSVSVETVRLCLEMERAASSANRNGQ